MGDVWETLVVNCFEAEDDDMMDEVETFNEGRWLPTVRKPLLAFAGQGVYTSATDAGTLADARKTDRTNVIVACPQCLDFGAIIAGRAVARVARMANTNPPHDYGRQALTGLTAGAQSAQLTWEQRDARVKLGACTTIVRDGVVEMSDTVTCYHPSGDPTPAWRYVCDVVKWQQVLFNLDLIFATAAWDGAPLIPDDQPTSNRSAKKPKMAVAEVAGMIDGLSLEAILSDPETAKATIVAAISSTNPKRLDLAFTVQLSGNTNILSIDANFGFYFGAPVVVE
jgi:hypothetical protein